MARQVPSAAFPVPMLVMETTTVVMPQYAVTIQQTAGATPVVSAEQPPQVIVVT